MWLEFCLVTLCLLVILELPGFFCLRSFGFPKLWSLCAAPLAGLSILAIIGQVFALLGLPVSGYIVVAIAIVIPAALFIFQNKQNHRELVLPILDMRCLFISFLLGIVLGTVFLLKNMGSPDALFQEYDVTQHLNLIQSMVDSGRLTSLGVNPYMSTLDSVIAPVDYSGFYPAAWHVLCALGIMLTGATVTTTINASMFLLACVLYPVAMNLFIAAVFPDDKRIQFAGSICGVAFIYFPWYLLIFGPVYANVAGFSLMPIAMALFVLAFAKDRKRPEALKALVLLALCVIGLALCHPNTIFTCVVFLAPYCVVRIWEISNDMGYSKKRSYVACILFVLFCLAFWLFCFKLPALQDTVMHKWVSYARLPQAIMNVLTTSYCFGFNSEVAAQLLLAFVVLVGAVGLLCNSEKRWVAVAYGFACCILIVGGTRDGNFKQLVAGFWYTDPMRLAAICSIAAVPVAAAGLSYTFGFILRLREVYLNKKASGISALRMAIVCAVVFLLVNFAPSFNLAGTHYKWSTAEAEKYKSLELRDWPKTFHTTFGDYVPLVESTFTCDSPLSTEEDSFIDAVEEQIDKNDLVINNPMDGSFLAYGLNGVRVYYRNFVGMGGSNETAESIIVRTKLCDYATDADVQQAVSSLKAKYVLVLEGGIENANFLNLRRDYDESLFVGITSITEETPGFNCIYSSGNLKLYEIEDL